MGRPRKYTEENFWSFLASEDSNGCRVWTGNINNDGYGSMSMAGKFMLAHRVAFILHNKIHITSKDHVCHRCDNPPCCNPAHLFIGNAAINMQDMWNKKRHTRPTGERNNHAILNEQKVIEIRRRYAAGEGTLGTLAKEYGVGIANVGMVVRRATWKHI